LTAKERRLYDRIYGDEGQTLDYLKTLMELIDDPAVKLYFEAVLAKRELNEKAKEEHKAMVECYRQMSSQAIDTMIKRKLKGTHMPAAKEALKLVLEQEKVDEAARLKAEADTAAIGQASMAASGQAGAEQMVREEPQPMVRRDDGLGNIRAIKRQAEERREQKNMRLSAIKTEIWSWEIKLIEESMDDVTNVEVLQVFKTVLDEKRNALASCIPPPLLLLPTLVMKWLGAISNHRHHTPTAPTTISTSTTIISTTEAVVEEETAAVAQQ